MRHIIEKAKSSRSGCKTCQTKIAKDEVRFGLGHPQENGSYSHKWFHLNCAASDHPLELEEALLGASIMVSNEAALRAMINTHRPASRPIPYAQRVASTYFCQACKGWSFPNGLAVMCEVHHTIGGATLVRHEPVDLGCAVAFFGVPNLRSLVDSHSSGLTAEEKGWLDDELI